MNLPDSDITLLDELERLSRSRLLLSKSLESAYTKQLSYINDGDIDNCLECIKTTDDIFSKLNDVNKNITQAIEGLTINKDIIQYALFSETDSLIPDSFNDIIHIYKTSNKVLKNCNTLNEKLNFQMLITSDEVQTKLTEIKNRKLIEQNYGRSKESKTGNFIDYKNK